MQSQLLEPNPNQSHCHLSGSDRTLVWFDRMKEDDSLGRTSLPSEATLSMGAELTSFNRAKIEQSLADC